MVSLHTTFPLHRVICLCPVIELQQNHYNVMYITKLSYMPPLHRLDRLYSGYKQITQTDNQIPSRLYRLNGIISPSSLYRLDGYRLDGLGFALHSANIMSNEFSKNHMYL